MEKVDIKRLEKQIESNHKDNQKKFKEMINFLAFQSQIQKQILNILIKQQRQKEDENANI